MQPGVRMSSLSLRDLTKAALVEILGGRSPSHDYGGGYDGSQPHLMEWSVLIFDNFSRDLIAPILKVGELRKLGVTLYLQIDTSREPVPDAPAVYLCQPTEENIKRIAQDIISEKYKMFSINWATPIPRALLELFAMELQPAQQITNVSVKDRFLSFVSPERDLFSLQMEASYFTIASGTTEDKQRDKYFEFIANGILHVLLALQVVPLIAWERDSMAGADLARILSNVVKQAVRDATLSQSPDVARPILLLCDRNTDLVAPLIQPSTYRACLHDTLKMHLNKVTIGKNTYEMEEADPWWNEFATQEMSEAIEILAKEVKEAEAREKAQKAELQTDDVHQQAEAMFRVMEGTQTANQQKRYLKTHTDLMQELSRVMQGGDLVTFNDLAELMLFHTQFKNEDIKKLINSSNSSQESKVRLALVHRLLIDDSDTTATNLAKDNEANIRRKSTPAAPSPDNGSLSVSTAAPTSVEPHLAFNYVRTLLKHMRQASKSRCGTMPGGGSSKAAQNIKNLFQSGQQFIQKLGTQSGAYMYPHTKVIDAVLQRAGKGEEKERCEILDTLECKDPKTDQPVCLSSTSFDSAIMFVVGGGNYLEYENIKKWELDEHNAGKYVMYGATELFTGDEFLSQLAHLGQEFPGE